jgi:hypothetical protein
MLRGPALLVVSVFVTACPRQEPVAVERACASACAGLAGGDCSPASRASCLESCRSERASAASARCDAEYEAFLSCLSRDASGCHSAVAEALKSGIGLSSCREPYAVYARCAEACREHGVVRTGTRTVEIAGRDAHVQAEVTTRGCAQALPEARRGAPPGSVCQYQSVCEPVTCACPSPSEGYRARVCVDGTCATPESACRLGPLAIGHRVCRP